MPPSPPFIDRTNGRIDTDRILAEARPLAQLIGLFVAIALVPLAIVFFLGALGVAEPLGVIFMLVAQFVLAVGAGIVLMYVVARGIQLAGK